MHRRWAEYSSAARDGPADRMTEDHLGASWSVEVDALRGLLIHSPSHLALDFAVLLVSVAVGVTTASSLVDRLAR